MMKTHADYKFSDQKIIIAATLIYLVVISFISFFHEVWADEVVLLSLIVESNSFTGFLSSLENYGHPPLFQIINYFGYLVFPHPVIIKIINISICVTAIYLFLLKSPFPWVQRILFICGIIPLYLFPVINRNYSLVLLLIMILSIFYKDRFRNFIPFCIILLLLTLTHAHAMLIAMAVFISLIFEAFISNEEFKRHRPKIFELIVGALIVIGGFFLFYKYVVPDKTSLIFTIDSVTLFDILNAFVRGVIAPGKVFYKVFGFENPVFVNLVIFSLYIYFYRKLPLLLIFSSGVVLLSMFFIIVYPSEVLRHQASLYLLIIFMLWIDNTSYQEHCAPINKLEKFRCLITSHKDTVFIFLLIIHVCMGYSAIKKEILRPYSSSKNFANFIKQNPSFHDAIIMAEQVIYLEALPYYVNNQLYNYRENNFSKVRKVTTEHSIRANISELLSAAEKLKQNTGKEILILLDLRVKPEGPYSLRSAYGKYFDYSKASLLNFYNHTEKIASFQGAIINENYNVFLLK